MVVWKPETMVNQIKDFNHQWFLESTEAAENKAERTTGKEVGKDCSSRTRRKTTNIISFLIMII